MPGKDRISGPTIVGQHAWDMLAEIPDAMRAGLGLEKILYIIHAYPPGAEANEHAAVNWDKAHSVERMVDWLAHYHAWRRG